MCREASDSSQPRDIVIHANELSYKDGFSTGDIIRYDCFRISAAAASYAMFLVCTRLAGPSPGCLPRQDPHAIAA